MMRIGRSSAACAAGASHAIPSLCPVTELRLARLPAACPVFRQLIVRPSGWGHDVVLRRLPDWGKGGERKGRGVMFDFARRLSGLENATVLCVGDLMLDTYVYGEVERISPEAPAQVLAVKREDVIVGGAGNVARNIAGLGARCVFVGIVGDDLAGKTLESAFARQADLIQSRLVVDQLRPTTRKTRFVSEHHSTHLLRADWEVVRPVGG